MVVISVVVTTMHLLHVAVADLGLPVGNWLWSRWPFHSWPTRFLRTHFRSLCHRTPHVWRPLLGTEMNRSFLQNNNKNSYLNNKLAFLQCITRQCMSCFKVDKGNTILLDKIISRSYNRSVLQRLYTFKSGFYTFVSIQWE